MPPLPGCDCAESRAYLSGQAEPDQPSKSNIAFSFLRLSGREGKRARANKSEVERGVGQEPTVFLCLPDRALKENGNDEQL
jgi:hypothetical protein